MKGHIGSQEFSGDLTGKMMVEMVIWRCRQREFEGVKRSCQTGNEKEEKERNEKKGAGQRDKGELKKEWWVVGLGGAWHVGNQKSDP